MKLFLKYLRGRRIYALMLAIFFVLFAVSFALFKIPVKAVIYPTVLCALVCAAFAVCDFLRFRKMHALLENVKKMSADTIADTISDFPESRNIEVEDYREILRNVCRETCELNASYLERFSDMNDYYTVWAHQIKTPIASARLNLQSEDSELSRKLSADLFRIEQYVEMVLAFLRLGSASTDYIIREYDLDGIIKCAVRKFAGEFIIRKISLEYSPVDVSVTTDEKWLSFVIEQIISNALKYSAEGREGKIKIYLSAPKVLCIEDTGIGIAREDLPRIFEKGYTGRNGRIDRRASGLGLYLCKTVCSRLGHKIEASSEVGVGTKIFLDLNTANIGVE